MSAIIDPRIVEILRNVAEKPDSFTISADQQLRSDLGIDSLMFIDVALQVESEFGVELGDDFGKELVTVADLDSQVSALVTTQ